MLLDDEPVIVAGHRSGTGYRLGCLGGVSLVAVGGQPIGVRRVVQSGKQIAVLGNPRQNLLIPELTKSGVGQFLPRAGRGDSGHLTAA